MSESLIFECSSDGYSSIPGGHGRAFVIINIAEISEAGGFQIRTRVCLSGGERLMMLNAVIKGFGFCGGAGPARKDDGSIYCEAQHNNKLWEEGTVPSGEFIRIKLQNGNRCVESAVGCGVQRL
ncbi:hypothetical protein F2P79_003261 [Pimephales promelas]|nr:hypothetical protein F2P79_003261 [Pimephales promelas]